MGVGLKNGEILLHNIKQDETIMKFYQDWGCVTFLSFRSGTVMFVVLACCRECVTALFGFV